MSWEKKIRSYVPRGSSDWERMSQIQPLVHEEDEFRTATTGRKEWQWKQKNAEPGPVTITKYRKETK